MAANPARVLILRGPIGVGKTTIAHILRERLAPAARLSIDTLRYFTTPRLLSVEHLAAAKRSAAVCALQYARCGISTIIESVFQKPEQLEELRYFFELHNLTYDIFTLRAERNILQQRNVDRDSFAQSKPGRVDELLQDYVWDIGHVIDTDELVEEESAQAVLEILEQDFPATKNTSGAKRIIFLRHASFNKEGDRYPLDGQAALSQRGRAQARLVGSALKRFIPTRIVSSPFLRAMETAQMVSEDLKIPITVDEGLRERHFTVLAGMRHSEIESRFSPDFLKTLLTSSEAIDLPPDESIDSAQARVRKSLAGAVQSHDHCVLVVSHGGPHSWLCCDYLGLPLSNCRLFQLDEAHFSIFEYDDGQFTRLAGLNLSL